MRGIAADGVSIRRDSIADHAACTDRLKRSPRPPNLSEIVLFIFNTLQSPNWRTNLLTADFVHSSMSSAIMFFLFEQKAHAHAPHI